MNLSFVNLVPEPLCHLDLSKGDIWKKNCEINSSSLVHICAPSGSGKTTFIHVLYGLRKDFTGSVLFDNNEIKHEDEYWTNIRLNQLSIIFQDLKLFEDLSAWENLILKNQLTNHLKTNEIEDFAARLGVKHLLEKKIKHISRGERQRIAIIRSLCMPFHFLLMDEPFSHLDDKNASLAAELILEQCRKNKAGLIMANLEIDSWFPYDLNLKLN